MSKWCHILMIFISVISCTQRTEFQYQPAIFSDSLYREVTILNDSFPINVIEDIEIYKNYVILKTLYNDQYFHIFDKYSGKLIKSFGGIGRGPGETFSIRYFDIDPETGNLIAIQTNLNQAIIYNIDSVLQNSHFYQYRKFDSHPFRIKQIFWKDKQFMVHAEGGKQNPGYRLLQIDSNNQIKCAYGTFPKDYTNKDYPKIRAASAVFSCISPNREKFAEAYEVGGALEIFTISDSIHPDYIKRFNKPEFIKQGNLYTTPLNSVKGFIDITASDDLIFGVYLGNRHFYWYKNVGTFDWQGNPLKLYLTDYNLQKICFDGTTNRIYAGGYNKDDEAVLLYFEL